MTTNVAADYTDRVCVWITCLHGGKYYQTLIAWEMGRRPFTWQMGMFKSIETGERSVGRNPLFLAFPWTASFFHEIGLELFFLYPFEFFHFEEFSCSALRLQNST